MEEKVSSLLKILQENPFTNPPPYEKLVGDLSGYYSRRINIKHRLVYKVMKEEQTELFRINGGKEGYYLVDLKDRDYWYFENEGTLHKNLLEWKVGVLVPVAEFQQN